MSHEKLHIDKSAPSRSESRLSTASSSGSIKAPVEHMSSAISMNSLLFCDIETTRQDSADNPLFVTPIPKFVINLALPSIDAAKPDSCLTCSSLAGDRKGSEEEIIWTSRRNEDCWLGRFDNELRSKSNTSLNSSSRSYTGHHSLTEYAQVMHSGVDSEDARYTHSDDPNTGLKACWENLDKHANLLQILLNDDDLTVTHLIEMLHAPQQQVYLVHILYYAMNLKSWHMPSIDTTPQAENPSPNSATYYTDQGTSDKEVDKLLTATVLALFKADPRFYAIYKQDVDTIVVFINHIHSEEELVRIFRNTLEETSSILHGAAKIGHTGIIALFVAVGVDINTPDKRGAPPLYYAMLNIAMGRDDNGAVDLLLKHHANIKSGEHGFQPIAMALKYSNIFLEKFLKYCSNAPTQDSDSKSPIGVEVKMAAEIAFENEASFFEIKELLGNNGYDLSDLGNLI